MIDSILAMRQGLSERTSLVYSKRWNTASNPGHRHLRSGEENEEDIMFSFFSVILGFDLDCDFVSNMEISPLLSFILHITNACAGSWSLLPG